VPVYSGRPRKEAIKWMLMFYVNYRDGIMLLGAGVNLAVSAQLHYVIGKPALPCFFSLLLLLFYYYFAFERVQSTVMSTSVHLSACMFRKLHGRTS